MVLIASQFHETPMEHVENPPQLIKVDISTWRYQCRQLEGEALGLVVLGSGGPAPVILAAVRLEDQTSFHRFDQFLNPIADYQVDDWSWRSERRLSFPQWKTVVFGARTWAQWLDKEVIDTGVQILQLDEKAGEILDITPGDLRRLTLSRPVGGCCSLPGGLLLVTVWRASGCERGPSCNPLFGRA